MSTMTSKTDLELIRNFLKNEDGEAIGTLISRHEHSVKSALLLRLGNSRNIKDDVNEVFQEACYKAMIALRNGEYEHKNSFAGWLYTIAKNVVRDKHRMSAKFVDTDVYELCNVIPDAPHENPLNHLIHKETRDIYIAHFNRNKKLKFFVMLMDGWKLKELIRFEGIHPITMRVRRHQFCLKARKIGNDEFLERIATPFQMA